jgi:hypothetical protein
MRLLPHQHWPCARWTCPVQQWVAAVAISGVAHRWCVEITGTIRVLKRCGCWPHHLGPSSAVVPLEAGIRSGILQHIREPSITSLQQLRSLPQYKVRLMPPAHLVVVLAVPTVRSVPSLLRWSRSLRAQHVVIKEWIYSGTL